MLNEEDRAAIEHQKALLATRLEGIRATPRMSDEGRAEAVAEAFGYARSRVQTIAQEANARVESRVDELRGRLFRGAGDGADAVAYRDAFDRIKQAEQDAPDRVQAVEPILKQALEVGDRSLAQAVFKRSFENYTDDGPDAQQWKPLLADYLNAYPDEADTAEELAGTIRDMEHPENNMRQSMMTSLPKPAEIRHMPDHQIDELAANADGITIPLNVQ